MSRFRPECRYTNKPALSDSTALYLIRDSVARRRELIFGRLHDGRGAHCAIGAFFTDNPNAVINADLIDEVAAVNYSISPNASTHERWKKVNSWLRWKLRLMSNVRAKA